MPRDISYDEYKIAVSVASDMKKRGALDMTLSRCV